LAGGALFTLKFLWLRLTQCRQLEKTEGVIFLTEYARDVVLKVTDWLRFVDFSVISDNQYVYAT
jgi:hypothetical protein